MTQAWQFPSPGNLDLLLDRIEPTPVEPAIASATAAARNWSKLGYPERIRLLSAVEAGLREISEELAMGIAREMGKPLTEARGELGAVLGKFALTFEDAQRYLDHEQVIAGPHPAEIRRLSRGPAVVIGPFNFPLHLANGAILPHLVAGNPVIFKPSPIGAVVAKRYGEVFLEHLPEGVFQIVQGGAEEGMNLCTDERVRAICFTGSAEVGRAIAVAVAHDFSKNVALEMGGKNALVLLADGDPLPAAKAAAGGLCATAGQRCNSTSRAIIHASLADRFCDALKEELKVYQPGDPCLETTMLGPLASQAAHQRYAAALMSGGEWLVEGAALPDCNGLRGYYVKPAARIWKTFDAAMQCPHLAIELFAPLIDIFVAQNDEEIIALHNATPFGLTASIFTSSRERFEEIGGEFHIGNLYANLATTFSPSTLPFGGCGLSGNGKPASRGFIRFTTDEQAVQFGAGFL
jgi:acyl-CoA reductase-like NAD-dependent aldehyde dehydrogenase